MSVCSLEEARDLYIRPFSFRIILSFVWPYPLLARMAEAEEASQSVPSDNPPEESKPANEAQTKVATEQNEKALQLVLQAEKKVKSASTFIGGLFRWVAAWWNQLRRIVELWPDLSC